MMHFEELWEQCENLQKEVVNEASVQQMIEELVLKVNLYKAIDAKKELAGEDIDKIKSRTLGEILLTITGLSSKDNINVYESLGMALQYRSVELSSRKNPVSP